MKLVLVTGPRDAGKTRSLSARATRLLASGVTVGGVLSEAVVADGRKVSYAFRDLLTPGGSPVTFAVLRSSEGDPRPGYRFLDDGMAFGRASLLRAAAVRVTVLVVDEVGPLEMEGRGLWPALAAIIAGFDGELYVAVRPGLVPEVRSRLARGSGPALVLSPAEIDALP